MGNNLIFDLERQNDFKFFSSHRVKVDYSLCRLVLHIDKMLSIEVKWDTVLVESESFWWMLDKYVLIEVGDADRC